MTVILKFLTMAERAGAWLAGLALALMFALGLAEVVLRTALGEGFAFALEYTGYLVAASFLLGAGWTLDQERHVRLSLVSEALGPEGNRRLEIAATLIALVLAVLLAFGLASWAWGSFIRGDVSYFPSATPLWAPQALLALGPVILALSLVKRLILAIRGEHR